MLFHVANHLCFETADYIQRKLMVGSKEHDSGIPPVLLAIMRIKSAYALSRLTRVNTSKSSPITFKEVINATRWNVLQRLRLGNKVTRNNNR